MSKFSSLFTKKAAKQEKKIKEKEKAVDTSGYQSVIIDPKRFEDCKKIARDSEANVEEKRRGFSGFSNGFPKFPMRSSEAAAKTAWRFPNITIALFEETIYNQR